MSKTLKVYKLIITIGAVSYDCTLSVNEGKYTFSVARLIEVTEKGKRKLAKPIYEGELYFKPTRAQMKNAIRVIAAPDAVKYQPEKEETKITEADAPKDKKRKPLLT